MIRLRQRRATWWWPTRQGWFAMAALLIGVGARPVAAQISYAVFPATINQPTEAPRVTIMVQDSTIESVIHEIMHQAHMRPVYNNSPILARHVSVHVDHVSVADALAAVLKGTGLVAKMAVDGETVVIRPGTVDPLDQRRFVGGTVSGQVTDSASGQGLGGVQVRVAGVKNLSAVTSDSGHFTLRDIPAGDQVLMVRLFGYRPVDRSVTVIDSQRTMVRIVLTPVPTVLSGVVTTAAGMQRKIEVGNDITSLNVDSIMQVAPVMSVTDLLETRVPGLTVTHSSGEPGAPSRLRLRGVRSISENNDPIIIVDGIRIYANQSDTRNNNLAPVVRDNNILVGGSSTAGSSTDAAFSAPSPIDQIDPNSIETIEVFKGPSASALYGSDAANGVIIITTKHGRAGPTHWSLDLGQGINWIPGDWPTNYFRFGTNITGNQPICNWYDPTCVTVDSVRSYQALNDPQNTLLGRGSDQTVNLTISGGVPAMQYSISGSGAGDVGNLKLPTATQQLYESTYGPIPHWMVRPDNYTTWGVNGSVTVNPSSALHVTLQSSFFNSTQQTSSLQQALTQVEGEYISDGVYTYMTSNGSSISGGTDPFLSNYVERATAASGTSTNALTLGWTPRPWLPINATGGLSTMQRTDQTYVPYGIATSGVSSCITGATSCTTGDTTGFFGLGRGVSLNQTLSVGTTIPLFRQRLSLALGGNYFSETTNDFQASTNQLAPGVSAPTSFFVAGCTTDCGDATQQSSGSSTYGWYIQPMLKIASRFFVTPGFRLDGGSGGTHATSTGGAAGGLSVFPKIDLSYVAVDRQGSRPLWGVLTLFRPRIALGIAGTQPSPTDRLRLFNVDSSSNAGSSGCGTSLPLNGTTVPGACLSTLGNTQLHPERSRELEGGFDASLWNGRFSITYTQYDQTLKDAIITIPVAPSVSNAVGSFSIAENIGEVRNTGTELTVNTAVLESRALSWNVGANLSNNNNLLVHLNPGQAPSYPLGLVPGYPLFGKWIQPIVSYADKNRDGIIEANEIVLGDSLVYLGEPNPKYQLNLTSDLHLLNGRLGVYVTFAYQSGLTQTNSAALQSTSFLLVGNNPSTPLSYQAAVMAATCNYNGGQTTQCLNTTTNYGLVQTVNTFRFNDLSINYELPRALSSWFRVPRTTIALQGSNLALHSNYRGKDPDVNAFSTVSAVDETADTGQIPEPRTWWLKLTLGN